MKITGALFLFIFMFAGFTFSQDIVEQNLDLLKSKNAEDRRKLAEDLGSSQSEKAVKPLIKLLKDKNLRVRISAADALGNIGAKEALNPLIKLIQKDEMARPIAIRSLGKLKNPKAIPVLTDMLMSGDPLNVLESALALSHYDSESVSGSFVKALASADDYGCQAIVNILGKKKVDSAVSALIKILENPRAKPGCALAVADALGNIGNKNASPVLMGLLTGLHPDELKANAIRSLGKLSITEAYPVALDFLQSPSEKIRQAAIEALVGIGDNQAVSHIQKALNDESEAVRDTARYALNQFGAKEK